MCTYYNYYFLRHVHTSRLPDNNCERVWQPSPVINDIIIIIIIISG